MAMVAISRLHKIALLRIGAVRSLRHCHIDKSVNKYVDVQSWTRNYVPTVKWEYNWDYLEPKSIVKPPKPGNPEDEKRYNEEIEKAKTKFVNHYFLIPFANTDGSNITSYGEQQAELTGKRLASLNVEFGRITNPNFSTKFLATTKIIEKHLPVKIKKDLNNLLCDHYPIPKEPPSEEKLSERSKFTRSAVLEAAFRAFFCRATASQTQDFYRIIICNRNAISFFVCRALQFPPEAWGRLFLNDCSITWLSVQPNGEVILRALNETGHMEPEYITEMEYEIY